MVQMLITALWDIEDPWTLEFIALLGWLTDWNTGWGPGDRDARSPSYILKLWWHVPTVWVLGR